jgi:hypothetical protein
MTVPARFRQTYGSPTATAPFTAGDRARLSERLPAALLDLWSEDGWASYRGGLLRWVDPDVMASVGRAWFPSFERVEVFAVSSFGELLAWDGTSFFTVLVHDAICLEGVPDAGFLLGYAMCTDDFVASVLDPARQARALEACGPLEGDQIYTFVPALALGGDPGASAIERASRVEALTLLASLVPISYR